MPSPRGALSCLDALTGCLPGCGGNWSRKSTRAPPPDLLTSAGTQATAQVAWSRGPGGVQGFWQSHTVSPVFPPMFSTTPGRTSVWLWCLCLPLNSPAVLAELTADTGHKACEPANRLVLPLWENTEAEVAVFAPGPQERKGAVLCLFLPPAVF